MGNFKEFLVQVTTGNEQRNLSPSFSRVAALICAGFSAFYLYTSLYGIISTESHLGIYFMITLALTFIFYKGSSKSLTTRPSIIDWVLVALVVICIGYWINQYDSLIMRLGWQPSNLVVLMGGITILISMEAARRVTGPIIPVLTAVFLLYAFFGTSMPGPLKHCGYPIWRIVEYNYITNEGMLGMITNIFASYIFVFIIFGAFLERSGLGSLFIDTALALTGHRTGGPGIVACIASGFMGMVSGSPVANVVTTGSFTIPLMKRVGYTPEFAGAVEAAASTGGQYMPPIMGAAAFILAEFTGTPYIRVVMLSIIPAFLYFGSVGLMIYLEARKKKLHGLKREELPTIKSILVRSYLFIPVAVIITLMVKGYSPFFSAVWAIITTVILSWLRAETRMGPKEIFEALVKGARTSLAVGALVGCLGVILGTSLLTGLPSLLSGVLTKLSFDMLPLLIFWLIVSGYIIGMGLPATPAYLILSLFGVPALALYNIDPLVAHLIVFWVAVNSVITPPVALAAMAAASISGGNPYRTGFLATKLGSWLYLMPFLFVYTPILMVNGFNARVLLSIVTALIGMVSWASAMEGFLLVKTARWERMALLSSALLLLFSGVYTDVTGVALLALVIANQIRKNRVKANDTKAGRVSEADQGIC
jgi:TRAP transporter 4TM/12TM fusion protein